MRSCRPPEVAPYNWAHPFQRRTRAEAGSVTVAGASNGFAALIKLSDGTHADITADDALFAKLLLWTDTNHNGVSEPSELRPFGDVCDAIALSYHRSNRRDGNR
jgi:hypothetical protein